MNPDCGLPRPEHVLLVGHVALGGHALQAVQEVAGGVGDLDGREKRGVKDGQKRFLRFLGVQKPKGGCDIRY